jgi:hypothetical protein
MAIDYDDRVREQLAVNTGRDLCMSQIAALTRTLAAFEARQAVLNLHRGDAERWGREKTRGLVAQIVADTLFPHPQPGEYGSAEYDVDA